jgi:hypothetical protein
MRGNSLVQFLEGLEAATPPGYSAGSRKSARNGNSSASYPTKCISLRPASDVAPQLITHVETTPAPLPDAGALSTIHTDLAKKELLPYQHLVDAGYVTVANLVTTASDYGVDLVGARWQTIIG